MKEFHWCTTCNEVFRRGLHETAPVYRLDPQTQEYEEIPMDDWQDFLRRHDGHPIRSLQILGEAFYSHDPYGEAIRTDYYVVTDGASQWVLKRYRDSIEEPMRYEIVPGEIRVCPPSYSFQWDVIQAQWMADKAALQPIDVLEALNALRCFASTLREEWLEEYDHSLENPMESFARLTEEGKAALLTTLQRKLEEVPASLRAWVERESEPFGALEVVVTRGFEYVGPEP